MPAAILIQVMMKKKKAEKLLEKLENASEPPREEHEKEAISEEERYMLRKVGLRMKPFLLMGKLDNLITSGQSIYQSGISN